MQAGRPVSLEYVEENKRFQTRQKVKTTAEVAL